MSFISLYFFLFLKPLSPDSLMPLLVPVEVRLVLKPLSTQLAAQLFSPVGATHVGLVCLLVREAGAAVRALKGLSTFVLEQVVLVLLSEGEGFAADGAGVVLGGVVE